MDISMVTNRDKYFLIIVVLASFLIRSSLFYWHVRHDENYKLAFDSNQYHEVAQQVAHDKGISDKHGVSNFYRLPAYPLFLGYAYKIFGGDVEKALWIQVVIASTVPLLIFLLAMTLFPAYPTIAKVAAVASALHPGFMLYAGIQSTEALFLVFFLLFLIFFFRGLAQHRLAYLFASGVFLSVASLFRAVGHYILILALILALLILKTSIVRRFYAVTVLMISWLSIVGIWLVRNYWLTGALFLHTLPGLHFLQYSAVYNVMDVDHSDYFKAKKKVFAIWEKKVKEQEQLIGRPLQEYERMDIAEQLAAQILLQYPLITIKHALIQMVRTSCTMYSTLLLHVPKGTVYGPDTTIWYKIKLYIFPQAQHPALVPFIHWELIYSLLVLVGVLLFMFFSIFDRTLWQLILCIAPMITLLIGLTVAYGCARLRMPIEPFLILLASYGWVRCLGARGYLEW